MPNESTVQGTLNRDQKNQPAVYQKSKENPSNGINTQNHLPPQVPMMVAHHYPSAGSFQQPYQQSPVYGQPHFYPQQHQHMQLPMTPSSAPSMSQPLNHQLPPQQQSQQQQIPIQPSPPKQVAAPQQHTGSLDSQFQTPQRNMPAPRIPNSASSTGATAKKHNTPHDTPESQRKKQRRSDHSAPGDEGDVELKTLAHKALETPIEELAAEVRELESQPSSAGSSAKKAQRTVRSDNLKERQKQVFAMSWLLRACSTSSNAVVPRNRIYARYVGLCADSGLKPLSPASFGKLVRILYPHLTTRRLGMRGQSKYHYCGLKLIGEDDNSMTPITSNGNTPAHNPNFDSSFLPGTPYGGSNSPGSFYSQVSTPLTTTTHNNSSSLLASFNKTHVVSNLKFIPDLLQIIDESAEAGRPLSLPDIRPYLPPSTDFDSADTLYGLYKSHCTSIFESLRYMQVKKLFNLLTTFHTSLTSPVLKLYTTPQILPWIMASDRVMYKGIMKMLAKLALQDIPFHVLQQLKQVSQTFTEKVSNSLTGMPSELSIAKLKLAKQFSQLVSRLVRVSETAQAANKVLSNEIDRDVMYKDWIKFVDIENIASKELPCDGENYKKAIELLQVSIPELLKKETKDVDSVINDWGNYISAIPQDFVDVPPRLFLLCTSAILTSALREISLAGGAGFGAWWVFRCWVDEWIGWCAELGGFVNSEDSALLPEAVITNGKEHENGHQEKEEESKAEPEQVPEPEQEQQENQEKPAEEREKEDEHNEEKEAVESVDLLDGQFGKFITNGKEDKK